MAGSVGGVHGNHPWSSFAGDAESAKNEEHVKQKYSQALTNHSDNSGVNFRFDSSILSVDVLQKLYIVLDSIFTDLCLNEHRSRIIWALLSVPQEEWSILMKQVCFIMPIGTEGHDVMWATEILGVIQDRSHREQVVNTAHGLFTLNTSTSERGYILKAVRELPLDEVERLYRADKEERTKFVNSCLPSADFRKGFKVIGKMDPCQNVWVKLEEGDDGDVRITK